MPSAFRRLARRPPVGLVRFGSLRRLVPVSSVHGFDRGLPISRYYIEDFLARHAGPQAPFGGDIRGHVLEVGDRTYADRFGMGGTGGVTQVDILHRDDSNPAATIVGDLESGQGILARTFDCIICTQVLPFVLDVSAAVQTLHRALTPGGVALVTLPGISPSCRTDLHAWGDYWRFTTASARRLFETVFPAEAVSVSAYGNVFSTIAFLHGLAVEDVEPAELDPHDPDYELIICVRAVKSV